MVGQRFCERLVEFDADRQLSDRHVLRGAAAGLRPRRPDDVLRPSRRREARCSARPEWYAENGVELHIGDRATRDRPRAQGRPLRPGPRDRLRHRRAGDRSAPFVPPVPGIDKPGVFVYRTIEDLEQIIAYAETAKRAAVIGGGLLGPRSGQGGLRPRPGDARRRVRPAADAAAGRRRRLAGPGQQDRSARRAGPPQQDHQGDPRQRQGRGDGVRRRRASSTSTWSSSRPASGRATSWPAQCGLTVGAARRRRRRRPAATRPTRTSSRSARCALHRGMIYGLVAPGYEMAEIVAANLTGGDARVHRRRPVDQAQADGRRRRQLRRLLRRREGGQGRSPSRTRSPASTRSSLFSPTARGCSAASWSATLATTARCSMLAKSDEPLPLPPDELLVGQRGRRPAAGIDAMPDAAQVCSCNNVTKGDDLRGRSATRASTRSTRSRRCTKAGTGCGGCVPLVTDLFKAELKAAGKTVNNAPVRALRLHAAGAVRRSSRSRRSRRSTS